MTGKIDICEADVAQAFEVYTLFACCMRGGYHDVYLWADVLILVDVFPNFRHFCMKVYEIVIVQFSARNLSWDAMLTTTRVNSDRLIDIDMLLFFVRGIRGGIKGIGELRPFQANERGLDDFDDSKANVCSAFFDVTFFYAGTMQ